MAKLTTDQLIAFAYQAGFRPGAGLDTIVSIAQAESSGDPNATHTNTDGSVDKGILQINSIHGISDACAFNPACSFNYAYNVLTHGGQHFTAWTTYTSGAYHQFLVDVQNAITTLSTPLPGTGGGGGPLGGLASAVSGIIGGMGSAAIDWLGGAKDWYINNGPGAIGPDLGQVGNALNPATWISDALGGLFKPIVPLLVIIPAILIVGFLLLSEIGKGKQSVVAVAAKAAGG